MRWLVWRVCGEGPSGLGVGGCGSVSVLQPWSAKVSICSSALSSLFSAFCPQDWALEPASHGELTAIPGRNVQGTGSRYWLLLFPTPFSCREIRRLWEAASLLHLVHRPIPRVLNCASSFAQIPYADVLVCSLGVYCWVLDVQLIVKRGEIWRWLSLCHISPFFHI